MASYPRLILPFAATAAIAALLWTAAPALAADRTVAASEIAATAKAAHSVIKRHVSRRNRIAASYDDRRVSLIRRDLGCSGAWCGRQFVLIVGVGF